MRELKLRERHRRGYSKEAQGYIGWHEWQVVDGRKIIGRFDMREQAERCLQVERLDRFSTLMGPDSDFQ